MFALVCLVASGQPACGLSEATCARCMPTASIGCRTMSVGVKPDEAVVKWFSLFSGRAHQRGHFAQDATPANRSVQSVCLQYCAMLSVGSRLQIEVAPVSWRGNGSIVS